MTRLLIIALVLFFSLPAMAEEGFIRYAPADGEYAILLPEAPTVESIWPGAKAAEDYLAKPPALSIIGEKATYQRVDSDTGDSLLVRMTTIKSEPSALENLTREKIESALNKEFDGVSLEKKQINYSAGSKTLKWATLTGYSIDKDNRLFFNAAHYLAGLESVVMVRISFALENRRFKKDYETIGQSIKFIGR